MDKIKKTKRNIIYGFINKIVLMLCPFAVRSIIIWKMGMEYVGLNSLFASILQVLSLAELGFGTAIVYSMYKPVAENDASTICALLKFYRKIYYIIGMIISIVGVIVIPFLPKLISGEYPNEINIYVLFVFYLLNTVLSYFMFAYKQSLLLVHQRVDVENNIATIVSVVMYIAQGFAIVLVKNYYLYVLAIPIATILINILRNNAVIKLYPQYKCDGELSKELKKDLYKRVFGLMLTRICQVCRNAFDSIVISAFLGLVILGRYQNYYYILNTVLGFLQIITSSTVGAIGNSIATKTKEENLEQFKVFHFGYNWIASWCTVCLLCLYQPFMRIWVGESNMFSMLMVVLMCVYFYSLKVGDVVSLYKEATGIYWEDKTRPILESVANLVLNFILVKFFGVYGVVIATIITIVGINIPWSANILFKIYFERKAKVYFVQTIKYLITLILVGCITYVICGMVSINLIWDMIIRGVICIIIPNACYLVICKFSKDGKIFFDMVKKMLHVG